MADDKTEEATPKRLRKAEDEGDVPVSAALTSSAAFLVACALAPAAVRATTTFAGESLVAAIATRGDVASFGPAIAGAAWAVVALSAPVLLAAAGAAALAGGV